MFELPIAPPTRGSRTIISDLHRQLRAAIIDGRLAPGHRLPSTREFAVRYQVSRNTAAAVYDRLLSEGYLYAHDRSGSYVSDLAARQVPVLLPEVTTGDLRLNPLWRNASTWSRLRPELPRYDLRVGLPDSRHFPWAVWRRLETRAIRNLGQLPAAYFPAAGLSELRTAIARHVAHTRAVACSAENILVTAGAQQAFDVIARVLVSPERSKVAVEEPGYAPLRTAFSQSGARLVHVAVDDDGLCTSELPPDCNIICVTPSHQFPTGVLMSHERRVELLRFAAEHNAVIVEDDYDSEFRFTSAPIDALQTLDRNDCTFYVGTFSKSMFPGLRMGFIVSPRWAQPALAAAKQSMDWHSPAASQLALASFITEGHLARHIRKMRAVYDRKRRRLVRCFEGSRALRFLPSTAGMHISAELEADCSIEKIIGLAREAGIGLNGWEAAGRRRAGISFGLGRADEDSIEVAGAIVRAVIE